MRTNHLSYNETARKYLCEKRRAYVDNDILFSRYVDNVPDNIVAPLNTEWEKKIKAKVSYGKKNNEIFDENSPKYQRQMKKIEQDFFRQMKMCRILTEMMEPVNGPKFKARSLVLRPFFKNIPTEKKGIVNRCSDMEKKINQINKFLKHSHSFAFFNSK